MLLRRRTICEWACCERAKTLIARLTIIEFYLDFECVSESPYVYVEVMCLSVRAYERMTKWAQIKSPIGNDKLAGKLHTRIQSHAHSHELFKTSFSSTIINICKLFPFLNQFLFILSEMYSISLTAHTLTATFIAIGVVCACLCECRGRKYSCTNL